jgi:hypothetical protein
MEMTGWETFAAIAGFYAFLVAIVMIVFIADTIEGK